MNFKFHLQQ